MTSDTFCVEITGDMTDTTSLLTEIDAVKRDLSSQRDEISQVKTENAQTGMMLSVLMGLGFVVFVLAAVGIPLAVVLSNNGSSDSACCNQTDIFINETNIFNNATSDTLFTDLVVTVGNSDICELTYQETADNVEGSSFFFHNYRIDYELDLSVNPAFVTFDVFIQGPTSYTYVVSNNISFSNYTTTPVSDPSLARVVMSPGDGGVCLFWEAMDLDTTVGPSTIDCVVPIVTPGPVPVYDWSTPQTQHLRQPSPVGWNVTSGNIILISMIWTATNPLPKVFPTRNTSFQHYNLDAAGYVDFTYSFEDVDSFEITAAFANTFQDTVLDAIFVDACTVGVSNVEPLEVIEVTSTLHRVFLSVVRYCTEGYSQKGVIFMEFDPTGATPYFTDSTPYTVVDTKQFSGAASGTLSSPSLCFQGPEDEILVLYYLSEPRAVVPSTSQQFFSLLWNETLGNYTTWDDPFQVPLGIPVTTDQVAQNGWFDGLLCTERCVGYPILPDEEMVVFTLNENYTELLFVAKQSYTGVTTGQINILNYEPTYVDLPQLMIFSRGSFSPEFPFDFYIHRVTPQETTTFNLSAVITSEQTILERGMENVTLSRVIATGTREFSSEVEFWSIDLSPIPDSSSTGTCYLSYENSFSGVSYINSMFTSYEMPIEAGIVCEGTSAQTVFFRGSSPASPSTTTAIQAQITYLST